MSSNGTLAHFFAESKYKYFYAQLQIYMRAEDLDARAQNMQNNSELIIRITATYLSYINL